jgi:transposase, IS5 family
MSEQGRLFRPENPACGPVTISGPRGRMTSTPCAEGIEVIMFRTIGDRPPPWESLLPPEVLRLPEDLARVDALLDDPVFFAPYFHPVLGRPSTPVECYLRLMFLEFRYRLGVKGLCAEVSDSISWRRFCRIPLDGRVPHPTTLMKLTTRCGEKAVAGLNEALLARAAGQKLLRVARQRPDTTVVPRQCVLIRPTRGCWPGPYARSRRPGGGSRPPAGRGGPVCATAAARSAGGRRPVARSRPWWRG